MSEILLCVKSIWLKNTALVESGLNPSFTTHWFCDLRQGS